MLLVCSEFKNSALQGKRGACCEEFGKPRFIILMIGSIMAAEFVVVRSRILKAVTNLRF